MKWYAAHTLSAMQRVDGIGRISVFENIYLISAPSRDIAVERAESILVEDDDIDLSIKFDGVPVRRVFYGIRKIISISNKNPPQNETPPAHGTEITYLEYEVRSVNALKKLCDGISSQVFLID